MMPEDVGLGLVFNEAVSLIDGANRILLVSHDDPDPDAISSLLALKMYIQERARVLGREIDCVLFTPNPPRANNSALRVLQVDLSIILTHDLADAGLFDLCIAVDYGDFRRTHLERALPEEHPNDLIFIGFDHHLKDNNSDFPAGELEIVDVVAASCTVLIYKFFRHLDFPISAEIANILLLGLLTDTGKMSNHNVNAEALQIAADLMSMGGDYSSIMEQMRNKISLNGFYAQNEARQMVKINQEAGLAFLAFSQADLERWKVDIGEIRKIGGVLKSIAGMETGALCYELSDGNWYVSLRSSGNIDVFRVARKFEGGGHERAAGFTVKKGHLAPDEIYQRLSEIMMGQN